MQFEIKSGEVTLAISLPEYIIISIFTNANQGSVRGSHIYNPLVNIFANAF